MTNELQAAKGNNLTAPKGDSDIKEPEVLMQEMVGAFQESPVLVNSLLWELAHNSTEFAAPIVLAEELTSSQEIALIPQMQDIMLAKVTQLGHRDKYPKPYNWEYLLATLKANEELLWIATKQENEPSFRLYVGIKFNQGDLGSPKELLNRQERFQVFCDAFSKRVFPESTLEPLANSKPQTISEADLKSHPGKKAPKTMKDFFTMNESFDKIFCVAGMPSLKDADTEKVISERKEESRSYSSLNDVLESHLNVSSPFTIVFSVSPTATSQVLEAFQRKFNLRDIIKPFTQQEFNRSKGKTTGRGFNITPKHKTTNTTIQDKANFLRSMIRGALGTNNTGEIGKGEKLIRKYGTLALSVMGTIAGVATANPLLAAGAAGLAFGGAAAIEKTKNNKESWLRSDVSTSTTIVPEVRSESGHEDFSENYGQTIHVSRSDLVFIDKQLEQSINHLQQALSGGGYFATAMVYTNKQETGESLARSLRSALAGSQSYLRPMQIFQLTPGSATKNFFQLKLNIPIANILTAHGFELEILNRDKAGLALLLPDANLPGDIKLKQSVFYGRPNKSNGAVQLGDVSYFTNNLRRRATSQSKQMLTMPVEDIFSHFFVVGAPGGGKSIRSRFILNHLPPEVRLVVLETAKREYGETIHRDGKKTIRYTLGNSQVNPLRVNPFYFDEGTSLKQHIAVLADAIADLLPMEALIGPKLREAVENCYKNLGWDLETSKMMDEKSPLGYPDMLDFNLEVVKICETLKDYGPEVRSNYTGALKNRAAIFLDGVYQDIFAYGGNQKLDELFPPDADVVVEMEDMPPSEINMPAFIISVILQRIRAYRFLQREEARKAPENDRKALEKQNRFLIAIEEAHNVLSRKIEEGSGDEQRSGKGGQLLRQVIRLLAEGRGLGIGVMVIDQAAHAIAPSVLADTNTKIIFHQEDGEEVRTIGKSIGLDEKDWKDFQLLGKGECIVKSKEAAIPVKLAPLDQPDGDTTSELHQPPAVLTQCAPYIKCEMFLRNVFKTGMFSWLKAGQIVTRLLDWCSIGTEDNDGNNSERIRYVWGKYLFDTDHNDQLEYHLKESRKKMDKDKLEEYYVSQILRQIRDEKADCFLETFNNPDLLRRKLYKPEDLLDGIDTFFEALEDDFDEVNHPKIEEYRQLLKDLYGELLQNGENSRVKEVIEKIHEYKRIVFSQDPDSPANEPDPLSEAWDRLAIHVDKIPEKKPDLNELLGQAEALS